MKFCTVRHRGITLIEVLFVIGIIGMLSSIATFAIQEVRERSRDAQRVADIAEIQLAFKLYRQGTPTGELPTHKSGIVIGEGGALDGTLSEYLGGTIGDPLGDPAIGEDTYEYVYDSDFNCPLAGNKKKVLYAKTMETSNKANWSTVCGTLPGFSNTYGVILQ